MKHAVQEDNKTFGRYISILDRLMRMYYDHGLEGYEIGWGQQFYVEYLYDHPGASAQEMVEHIRVDKGTLTKVVKKLTDLGYVKVVKSDKDKRIKLLYLTDRAIPAARRIKEVHKGFYRTLYANIPPSEIWQAEQTLAQMVENINQKIWHRMERGENDET